MSSSTFIRTIAVALTVSALGAPAALARPVDNLSPATQDLRHLSAGNDVRSSTPAARAALAQERSYSSYGEPTKATQPSRVVVVDGGTPWTTIALGIAGACLLLGSAAAFAGRTRLRTRRSHIAA
jgi:hypothetical protein